MHAEELQKHVRATYGALRWGAAGLGLALPWVLWLGGRLLADAPLQASMSAYYHTVMRDAFVGVLFAVASLLALYKGYTQLENVALNLAGAFLAGVALVPTAAAGEGGGSAFSLHGTFAVLFFLCIAYVCLFRASDTLALVRDPERARRFRQTYRLLGLGMILTPLAAVVLAFVLQPRARLGSITFFVEAAGVYVFSAYWLVKSREIRETDAERLALEGRLATPPAGVRNVVEPLPVQRADDEGPATGDGPDLSRGVP